MIKNYILDTNILMQSPGIINGLEDNNVLITEVTLEERDKHKNDKGESGFNAREVIRNIDKLRMGNGNFTDGYPTLMGGKLMIINKKTITESSKDPIVAGKKYKDIPSEWDHS